MNYRKHLRLDNELYRQSGYFFVTVVSRQRLNLFIGKGKEFIIGVLKQLPEHFPCWLIDTQIIMPNHIHLIFENVENNKFLLGDVIRVFKSSGYFLFKKYYGINETPWQRNYYERIIRSEQELEIVRKYIRLNPEKERYDWNNESRDKPCRYDF